MAHKDCRYDASYKEGDCEICDNRTADEDAAAAQESWFETCGDDF